MLRLEPLSRTGVFIWSVDGNWHCAANSIIVERYLEQYVTTKKYYGDPSTSPIIPAGQYQVSSDKVAIIKPHCNCRGSANHTTGGGGGGAASKVIPLNANRNDRRP